MSYKGSLVICHVVSAYEKRTTGPRNSVSLLSRNIDFFDGFESIVVSDVSDNDFEYNDCLIKSLKYASLPDADVYVFSGVYSKNYVRIASALRSKSIPYVVSPRSSLMKVSMRKSFFKKVIFIGLYGRRFLRGALAFHFLSDEEKLNSISLPVPSFVAGNGVSEDCFSLDFESGKNKVIGFMGRYDIHHKGLDIFMSAVKKARDAILKNGWKVSLRGPDFDGGASWLSRFIEEHDLSEIVDVGGEVKGGEKRGYLSGLSVFFHTSRYEGQPQAVMEAMAHGCAILVTNGTNMRGVAESGCGWVSEGNSGAIAKALESIVSAENNDQLVGYRESALTYAKENFGWSYNSKNFCNGILSFIK